LGGPLLQVRIGIHTGEVLAGTFGSDKKMKFGCMGDPVNLASRLEGLCKAYGVGIVCSSVTYDQLPSSEDFICRKLDLVQVKGRQAPVLIYEVMGRHCDEALTPRSNWSPSSTPAAASNRHRSTYLSPERDQPPSRARTKESLHQGRVLREASGHSTSSFPTLISTTAAAAAAMELSRVSLHSCEGLDWDDMMKQKRAKMLRRSASASPSLAIWGPAALRQVPQTATTRLRSHARRYEEALDAYQSARFVEAESHLKNLLVDFPSDDASIRLLKLVQGFIGSDSSPSPHAEDNTWTGVTVMTEK
jgi:hypothetical protein